MNLIRASRKMTELLTIRKQLTNYLTINITSLLFFLKAWMGVIECKYFPEVSRLKVVGISSWFNFLRRDSASLRLLRSETLLLKGKDF